MNEEDAKTEETETAGEFTGELNLDRLGELEKELEEVRQHVLYAQAETQNVRRRLEQEKSDAAAYAATGFARDMLSVKDNLERALAAIPEELREDERMKAPGRRHRGDRPRARQRLPAPRHRPRRGDGPEARSRISTRR